jgi:transketolase
MSGFHFIPRAEFERVVALLSEREARLKLIADMCRLNTWTAMKKAGSGHLGSSFSAMDINVWLYFETLNIRQTGIDDPERDIFFSSKGHDVPALYAVLHALGIISENDFLNLRRLGGLPGHPDVAIPGIEACTGSLGMGISKARGQALGKQLLGRRGRVVVMTGDGELQEGQIWESLQIAAHQRSNITVIVDNNKIQTDLPVEEVVALGSLEEKFESFGCVVERCSGHDFTQLAAAFQKLDSILDRPRVLIADTVKGKGISFLEEISAAAGPAGKYAWHSGAPGDDDFERGFEELAGRIRTQSAGLISGEVGYNKVPFEAPPRPVIRGESVAAAFGNELVSLAAAHPRIVVLDGDLAADCQLRGFAARFPGRFFENGIAEQDMVSAAGGLARQGLLPVVNSFAAFLCSRANEQIYNNACEGTKVIYAAHFAGLLPAGPGNSHQSVRDISLLGSLPNLTLIQPGNALEARLALRYAVERAVENCVLRLNIGPSPREIELPEDYELNPGKGVVLRRGTAAVLMAYGPVMLNEALRCAELLAVSGFELEVVNFPWLNRFDDDWLRDALGRHRWIFTLDDHMLAGGFGERLACRLAELGLWNDRTLCRFGLKDLPACGAAEEILRHHRLDAHSLASQIEKTVRWKKDSTPGASL